MTERPILFSAPMVRAILAGTKTQTRRVVKLKPDYMETFLRLPNKMACCPYGQPGGRLWVREAWRVIDLADCFAPRELTAAHRIWYEADGPHEPPAGRYRPGMFMPRWASRITLKITGMRVERLQDITADDAMAEGIVRLPDGGYAADTDGRHYHGASAWYSYGSLWEAINGPGSWEANPWVWVIDFNRVTP